MYHFVEGNHMVGHMYDETWAHEDMLFHKGGVCDTWNSREFQGFQVVLVVRSIWPNLNNFDITQAGYIPGGQHV